MYCPKMLVNYARLKRSVACAASARSEISLVGRSVEEEGEGGGICAREGGRECACPETWRNLTAHVAPA